MVYKVSSMFILFAVSLDFLYVAYWSNVNSTALDTNLFIS